MAKAIMDGKTPGILIHQIKSWGEHLDEDWIAAVYGQGSNGAGL